MRYILRSDEEEVRKLVQFDECVSIPLAEYKTHEGWSKAGHVRLGSRVYDIGHDLVVMLRKQNFLHGY
jgi:hypothetical protein